MMRGSILLAVVGYINSMMRQCVADYLGKFMCIVCFIMSGTVAILAIILLPF